MLKALREAGFSVTLYERRGSVGGLWAYSENPLHTTALPGIIKIDSYTVLLGDADGAQLSYSVKHQQISMRFLGLSCSRQ